MTLHPFSRRLARPHLEPVAAAPELVVGVSWSPASPPTAGHLLLEQITIPDQSIKGWLVTACALNST